MKLHRALAFVFLLWVTPASAQIINTLPFQLQNGTTADASQVMADFNQIVSNTNSNAAKNGVNSDITALTGLTTPLNPVFGGSSGYTGSTSTGSANAQLVATSPTGFNLTLGKHITFIAGFTNTGPLQVNANGTGLLNVYYPSPSGPVPLTGGEITAGNAVTIWYDGTQYELLTSNLGILGTATSLTAASTTDLGTAATHNITISGNTGITSFGSSASTAYPFYFLTFSGTPTITYNATSMILPGAGNIIVAANDTAIAQYLGSGNWQVWSYTRASGSAPVQGTPLCGATNWSAGNNAGTPNTNIDYSADSVVLTSAGGASFTVNNLSGTINTTNVGVVNGIQASRTLNAWYDIYIISDGTTTGGFAVSGALSAPSGYQYSCRLGAMKTDGSTNFYRQQLRGNEGQWVVTSATNTIQSALVMATGTGGSITVTNVWVPPKASKITGFVNLAQTGGGSGACAASPNGNYSSSIYASGLSMNPLGIQVADSYFNFVLEGSTINYFGITSTATCTIYALGWKDSVNAN